MDRYHIIKGEEKWKMTKEGNERASLTTDTKAEMLKKMSDFMENHPGSVIIHDQTGVFQEERTYPRNKDPRESKG